MKTFLWIAGSLFVILIGFIVGIFLAPLLASLTSLYVFIIPLVIAGLSLIAFIGLHLIYKKARRTSNRPSFYYPGLLIPIFLCSALLTIHSAVKFKSDTYDEHGIFYSYPYSCFYNRLGIKLFYSYDYHYIYAYDTQGNIYICCYGSNRETIDTYDNGERKTTKYRVTTHCKIYTIEGTLTKNANPNEFYYYDIESRGKSYCEYGGSKYERWDVREAIEKDITGAIRHFVKSMDLIPE